MALFTTSYRREATPSVNTGGIFSNMYKNSNSGSTNNNKFGLFSNLSQYHGIVRWADIIGKPTSFGGGVWGSITGTITNQTDLMNYLSTNYQPVGTYATG